MPEHLQDAYTMGGQIPIDYWYLNNAYSDSKPMIYSKDKVQYFMSKARRRENNYYKKTDCYLYQALDTHVGNFEGKTVGVIGSIAPWYEAIVLVYGGYPTTVEYNKIISQHPDVKVMTVKEYEKNPIQFDYLFSISSIEHDGLGRYGDPLNPNGDLEAMAKSREMLKDGGLLFLAVPVGPDLLVWNAHRIYGELRLPLLLQNWELIGTSGFNETDIYDPSIGAKKLHQPVFILRKTHA